MEENFRRLSMIIIFLLIFGLPSHAVAEDTSSPKYLIILIADGQGENHRTAANLYTGSIPKYQQWPDQALVSTFPINGSYDPSLAWTNFDYVKSGATDSAAAATALFSGSKTANGRISVSADSTTRLTNLGDIARNQGLGLGVVTTSFLSDATPSAFIAHNASRLNYYALADEALWGNPETTGVNTDAKHGGGYGVSSPPVDIWLGAGHPSWTSEAYITNAIRTKLMAESGFPGAFTYIERVSGQSDGGSRLIQASSQITTTRLAGIFGESTGDLDYRLADGSGHNPENPTLMEMSRAALTVLNRNPNGFVLMIESGAVDHSAHKNNMDRMIGEMIDFNQTIQEIINWIERPDTKSTWDNTLVIVTADHETGYLTKAPGILPDKAHPIGPITPTTLAYEKLVSGTSFRASWQDDNNNTLIDPGEVVFWAWNSLSHTNSLVRIYAHGLGSAQIKCLANQQDPELGAYMDNIQVFSIATGFLSGNSGCTHYEQSEAFVNHINGTRYFETSGGHGLNPWLSDTTIISFSSAYTETNQAFLYFTSDGSLPSGNKGSVSGTTRVLPCRIVGTFGEPAETIFTCQGIPPQVSGATIQYSLEVWNTTTGFNRYAASSDCSFTVCENVFSYNVIGPNPLFLSFIASQRGP